MPDREAPNPVASVADAADFGLLLTSLTGLDGELSPEVARAVESVISRFGPVWDIDHARIASSFYGRVNQKLGANKDSIAALYARCAARGLTFNHPTKRRIEWAINSSDTGALLSELGRAGVEPAEQNRLEAIVSMASPEDTKKLLRAETRRPTKLRKQPDRSVADDVFNAAAGPLAWSTWRPEEMASAFSSEPMPYSDDYMTDLRQHKPSLFERRRSLVVRQVRPEPREALASQRARLTTWSAEEYEALDNYGFLAVLVNVEEGLEAEAWELASDLPLYAERFFEVELKQMYFRWRDVRQQTLAHAADIDEAGAHFELMNEGFTYRDTFVLQDGKGVVRRLLLVMQKNRRDETKVPCPGCRSDNVGGNSYPNFGVKSWECRNPLCVDRSIYNRGKRYDFRSLLKQEAIETDGNQISVESVRRWQRDVLRYETDQEILDTLLAHYSMRGDVVALLDVKESPSTELGRVVRAADEPSALSTPADFWSSAFFARYVPSGRRVPAAANRTSVPTDQWTVLTGDALEVLGSVPADTFDRAVTSPPYYNAREYSQWPNLYCYMHDMYRIAEQVFRTLKPGGIYAYNIFDYFDNERIVTFSDMGKRRLLLSALMVDAFRRIGFEYLGSTVWDKGEIHGKRGFNAGNFSPFYQSPFACWEHVIVGRKPPMSDADEARSSFPNLNRALRIHPVTKMVRGKNVLGHTAPYPIELVAAMLDGLPAGSLVLDPFGGSGTTSRGALQAGHRSVLIERDQTYVDLSRNLTSEFERDLIARRAAGTLF